MKTKQEIKNEITRFKSLIAKEQDDIPIFNVNFVRQMIIQAFKWVIDED